MVIASHAIFTAYGFWLPNDPRGSWSDFVRNWEIAKFGKATKTDERRSVAHRSHDRAQRLAAKEALRYPPVRFSGLQARAIARGFARAIKESGYRLFACSIMPDHVHFVSERHERSVERIVGHLKARATQQLVEEDLHPFNDIVGIKSGRFPSVWVRRAWKVFLDSHADVERCIRYVNNNPIKEGFKEQSWGFVYSATC
jgi:REP element-mobilizing transposase RayT